VAKTYNSIPSVATGDVYTAAAHNNIVTNVNNYRVPPACIVQRASMTSAERSLHAATLRAFGFGTGVSEYRGHDDDRRNHKPHDRQRRTDSPSQPRACTWPRDTSNPTRLQRIAAGLVRLRPTMARVNVNRNTGPRISPLVAAGPGYIIGDASAHKRWAYVTSQQTTIVQLQRPTRDSYGHTVVCGRRSGAGANVRHRLHGWGRCPNAVD
jgi:hypothetical protein